MINTVVRSFNSVVLSLEVNGLKWMLSRVTGGDEVTLDRADAQFDAIREFMSRHPWQVWNPLFVLNEDLVSELRDDIIKATNVWEADHQAAKAQQDVRRREQYQALKDRILAERERARAKMSDQTPIASEFDGTAIPAKRAVRGKSRVTSVPFCTDGVGEPA